MENLVLLDTGIVFNFLGNKDKASETESLLNESRAVLSAITVFELFNGVTNKKHLNQREQIVSLCEVVDITSSVARKASEIYTRLKIKGNPIDNEDILIAACAISRNYPIFTNNKKHFEQIPSILFY